MDKTTILRTFNTPFFEFLDDILIAVPDSEVLLGAIASFQLVKKMNPTAIINVWYNQVYYPYNKLIKYYILSNILILI